MSTLLALYVGLLAPDAGLLTDSGPSVDAAVAKPAPTGPPPVATMECAPNPARMGEVVVCSLTVVHRTDVSITVTAPEEVVAQPPTPATQPRLKLPRGFGPPSDRPRLMLSRSMSHMISPPSG